MSCKYPDRWFDYTTHGTQVQGTQFIALKVPLDKKYFNNKSGESFTPDDVINKIPGLGLVIDLTFTTRYYNPSDFLHQNIQHKKIMTKGHVVPHYRIVHKFIDTVNDYLKKDQNKGKLIGVHCTHGLNRTGYLICAYMILVQGYMPDMAIQLFNDARTHLMERNNYLDSLLKLEPLSYKANRNDYNNLDKNYRYGNNVHTPVVDNYQNHYRSRCYDRPNNWRNNYFIEQGSAYTQWRINLRRGSEYVASTRDRR